MRPIFHLSFPVRDLQEAVAFYANHLGAEIGRYTDSFADALLFGAQVTLQNDPYGAAVVKPRTWHFGATIPWAEWETVASRFGGSPLIIEPPTVSYAGEPIEQGKMMIADPTGNRIEIKAYRRPDQVLGSLTES
jgi:extradiol dioxygenase family protein